ncbi:MAG: glycine cleavage system protein GcvH [Pirellulales bacterium]
MASPETLLYAKSHEWVAISQDGADKIATVGVSAFAVEALTDLVHMQLPAVGKAFKPGQVFGEIESVKAVSDLYSPVEGTVVEVNSGLVDKLETLNSDPYGAGWMVKFKLTSETGLSELLDYATYQKQCTDH